DGGHDVAGLDVGGLGIGIYCFSVNIAAYAFGSNLIGKLNDWLGASTSPLQLRYSLLICPVACALAALMLWLGSRRMEKQFAPPKPISFPTESEPRAVVTGS